MAHRLRTASKGLRYAPAKRLFLVRTLLESGRGVTLDEIQSKYEVSVRTAIRYLRALEAAGEPLDCEVREDRRKYWRLMPTSRRETVTMTSNQMISLFLSRRTFDFLKGTTFKEDLDDLFDKLEATLRHKDSLAVRDLDRKLYDVNERPWLLDEERLDFVNEIVSALLKQQRLRVVHEGVRHKPSEAFDFDPYTLLVFEKGLYIVGKSHRHGAIRTFALDGFRDAKWLRGQAFEYEEGYHPSKMFANAFALTPGALTDLRIFFTADVARYVRRRRWQEKQEITNVAGGIELRMRVGISPELVNWILSWGPNAEVLDPPTLRDEIADRISQMGERYRKK